MQLNVLQARRIRILRSASQRDLRDFIAVEVRARISPRHPNQRNAGPPNRYPPVWIDNLGSPQLGYANPTHPVLLDQSNGRIRRAAIQSRTSCFPNPRFPSLSSAPNYLENCPIGASCARLRSEDFSLEKRQGVMPACDGDSDTFQRPRECDYSFSWPSNDLASFMSAVSKPSVNQL